MGDRETILVGIVESSVRYHSIKARILTERTVSGGQFDWGGRLLKGNGGAQRFPQHAWKPCEECKSKRELDCKTDKSSRYESRL